MSISDVILVVVASASVAAVVVGIFAIIQAQIQSREALAESRAQAIASQKIAQEAQAESRTQSLKTLYALNRPILTPGTPLSLRNNDLDWDSQHCTAKIRNVGTGVALNVWGVLLPPKQRETEQRETIDLPQQYCLRSHGPISQEDKDIDTYFLGGERMFCGDEMIESCDGTAEKYPLSPPLVDLPPDSIDGKYRYVARLTLTYSDVFGRKHASIYDHTDRHRWKFVVHLDNIHSDLEGLHTPALSKVNQQVISNPLEEGRFGELPHMPTEELPSVGTPLA